MQAFIEGIVGGVSADIAIVVGALIGLGLTGKAFWTALTWLDKKLEDPANFEALKRALRHDGWARRWCRFVVAGLVRLDRWFGAPWSWRAFDRCLLLAFFYPVLAILIGWVAGGPLWSVVNDASTAAHDRAAGVVIVVASSTLGGLIFAGWLRHEEAAANVLADWLSQRLHRSRASSATRFMVRAVVAAGAAGAAGAVVAVVAAVAAGAILVILYSLLPVLNALLDWLSWAASRRLMRGLFPSSDSALPRRWSIVRHVAADLGLAIGFLWLLATVMAATLGLANRFGAVFPWKDFVDAARDDPLGAGLSVTIMLVSTLVPTALHLFAAWAALVLPTFTRPWMAQDGAAVAPIQRTWLVGGVLLSWLLSIFLFFVIGYLLFRVESVAFPHLGDKLADWALLVGSWAEGVPAVPQR